MRFPKKQVDELQQNLRQFYSCRGEPPESKMVQVDPKDLEDLILYAELSNAKLIEQGNDNAGLIFKLRMIQQALK